MNEYLKPQVLFVEDDPMNLMALERSLPDHNVSFDYTLCHSVAEAKAILRRQGVDVIITSSRLKDGTGFDLLNLTQGTPTIFLTVRGDEEQAVQAIQSGAHDYLIKDEDDRYLKLLPVVIDNAIRFHQTQVQSQQAEAALEEVSATQRALVTVIPDLILRVSRDGIYRECQGAKYFEPVLPPENLVGKTVQEVLPHDVAVQAMDCIERALQTQEIQTLEYQLLMQGSFHDYEARIVACQDDEVLVLVREITQRRKQEMKLQRQRQLLQGVADATSGLLTQKDYNVAIYNALQTLGRVTEVCRVSIFEHCMGIDPLTSDVLAVQTFAWINPASPLFNPRAESDILSYTGDVPPWYQMLIEGGSVKGHGQHLAVAEDSRLQGQRVLSRIRVPIFVDHQFSGFLELADSITERVWSEEEESAIQVVAGGLGGAMMRRQVELEMHRQHRRSQLLADMTQRIRQSLNLEEILNTTVTEVRYFLQADRVLIYRFEPDWTGTIVVESVDDPWSHALGAAIEDTCFRERYHGEYLQGRIFAIDDVEQTSLTPCHHTLLAQFQVKANLVVPIITNHELWGLLVAHQCANPRKWQPFEIDFLKQLADQVGLALAQARLLNQEIRQREQLAQQNIALEKARAEAEQSSQMKSRFLATISHEIRTPMNAILGMTGLLSDTEMKAEQRDYVEIIRTSGDNLLTLINEILDFSKLEANEVELEVLEFEIRICVEEVTDLLAAKAYGKGIDISFLIHPEVPRLLRGDVSRLRQILMNLADNAIKFTETGEVSIEVELALDTATIVTILFTVTDTGIGIDATAQEKLFHPFSQVDASTTRKYGGTGLGLAISRELVELMGGIIGLESQVGQGSTFWFSIPFDRIPDPEPSSVAQSNEQGGEELRGLRVLILDPHGMHRRSLSSLLTTWGMQVEEADQGAIALHTLRDAVESDSGFDLVIINQHLPDRDGESLAQTIWSDSLLASTPLVLMTSLRQPGTVQRMLDLGFSGCLVKPIKPNKLRECLLRTVTPEQDRHRITPHSHPQDSLSAPNGLSGSSPTASPPAPSLRQTSPIKLKILLAEDNLINQKVTVQQLYTLGYQADVVANGQEALEAVGRIDYDLILMDCQMPVLDGYSATQMIRQMEKDQGQYFGQRRVIIAMTAGTQPQDQHKAMIVGMDDYLQKPVSRETLATTIKTWSRIIQDQRRSMSISSRSPLNSSPAPQSCCGESAPLDGQLDWDSLHQLSDGSPEFELELLQLFVEDSLTRVSELEVAIAQLDLSRIEQVAHYLKGSSANIGAHVMRDAAGQLEQQSRHQQLEHADELGATIRRSLDQLHQYVQGRLSEQA